ncbi:MAG: 4-phosphopantetheinyl transferase [Mucilaginibacter sp.]|nr:4-phosphopantetheinyl transferase [Mucilaginibacter sp.]
MSYTFSNLDPSLFSQFFTAEFIGIEVLTPAEKALIGKAALKRQNDFSTGRHCARKALGRFGASDTEILTGEVKEPLWPAGFVGSISHSKKLTGAIVAKVENIAAVGLDVETIGGINHDMWDILFTYNEQVFLSTMGDREQALYSTLVFSFKEAFYKLQYPLTKQYVDFKEVGILCTGGHFGLHADSEFNHQMIPRERLILQWDKFDSQVICVCYLPVLR